MKYLNNWSSANKTSVNVEKTKLVNFKSPRKVLPDECKIKLSGERLYPSNSIKYLDVRIDRFLYWHGRVNSIAVKLNITNVLLLKSRNYVNVQTLINIYFVIFDSHLSCPCITWVQNISIIKRFFIPQKKSCRIINFIDQLSDSIPLFFSNNILKFGDKIPSENIIFVSESISRQVPSMFYDWFTFSGILHRYETCSCITNQLNILTFRTRKYGRFSIRTSAKRSWN